VRAVNLLPEKHRPRGPSGGGQGSSYILLGVLGAVLVGVLLYVLTINSINSSRTAVAKAKADTTRFQAEAAQLGPYGDFSKIKNQRVASVTQLAEGRVDWERMVREIAHVLPTGVWLTKAAAADSLGDAADTQAGQGFADGPGSSTGGSSNASVSQSDPVMTLSGCAVDQGTVATMLVRLREMQGANNVQLDNSTQPDSGGGAAASSPGGSSGSSDCGTTHGNLNYSFTVDIAFDPHALSPYQPGAVPVSLGGGQ
jgi:Tfp pilus assembly protein PilN